MPEKKERILWLDVLKGLLMMCVLVEHSLPADLYVKCYTPFFLTTFFFVSGITFSAGESFRAFALKRAKRLLIPLFSLSLIRFAMGYVLGDHEVLLHLIGVVLQINEWYDELWFIACMFTASLLFYGVARLDARRPAAGAVCAGLLCLAGMLDMTLLHLRFPWQLELACIMVPFMYLGYQYRRRGSWQRVFCSVPVIAASAALYVLLVFGLDATVKIRMEVFYHPVTFLLAALAAIIPLTALAGLLSRTPLHRPLSFVGQNTLFYFAFGGMIRIIFYAVTDRIGLSGPLLLSPICALSTALILAIPAILAKRVAPWLTEGIR